MASVFKGLGYLVSTLSVVLLGIVAWKSASQDQTLLLCLIGGMATSITGMAFRWTSHRLEQREEAQATPPAGGNIIHEDIRPAMRGSGI
jgi:hypothetical protein